jgi:hypothetical protein
LNPKFSRLQKMGATIAHEIPDPLPVGIEDEVPCSDIFSLIYEDSEFFKEMFQLIS